MKKGIKSLMLIAAAAMTFTSCQKENKAQVNDGKGTVKVNFTSVADGTKTYFGDRTTDKYPTLWTGDEKVGITYLDTDLDNEGNNVVEVNGKGETTTFSAELAEPSSKEGSILYSRHGIKVTIQMLMPADLQDTVVPIKTPM